MNMGKMRRTIAVAISMAALMLAFAAPVAAHNLTVEPKGNAEVKHGWTGSGPLPGKGKGLIPGGPGGIFLQSPSHAKGLNTACHATEANPSVVDIRGPGGPGCANGQ
jgi:hypothetical protein